MGGDVRAEAKAQAEYSFNPRLRVGGDHLGQCKLSRNLSFNPRLRVGGDAISRSKGVGNFRFQSTPPRGRRRLRLRALAAGRAVSIHASAWEATRWDNIRRHW